MNWELRIKLVTTLFQHLLFARPENVIFCDSVFKGRAFCWLPGSDSGARWKNHWPGGPETFILPQGDITLCVTLGTPHTLLGLIWQSVK